MTLFAVGFFSSHDNELKIEIIEAPSWRQASLQHSKAFWDALEENDPDDFEDLEDAENEVANVIPGTLEDAKREAFDMDGAFDCVEIPEAVKL